jgi:heptaprenyl diphosphate synthase
MHAVDGLPGYLEQVEERLAGIVEAHPGTVAAVGSDALAAGGKRLRPALTFLCSPPGSRAPVSEGAAIELVHMASLVHDDIVDEAGCGAAARPPGRHTGPFAAKATGDHLFARAFATLAATGSLERVAALADASLALARARRCSAAAHDPTRPSTRTSSAAR